MKDKALSAVTRRRMFVRGDCLLVAISGGADSVALLHFLCGLRKEWGLELGALHLNHCLRGEESERDEGFVRDLCEEWKVSLTVERADIKEIAGQSGESLEQCGRRLRYAFFEREAGRLSAKVAVGHTASDNAETMLINLTRGTALRGLGGIPPVRGMIIRPLIECSREEIEDYCRGNGLRWVDDSSNQSDDHTRNRVRRYVLPLLSQENPRIIEKLTHLSGVLRADADYLDALARKERERLARPNGSLERAGFLALDPALRGRVLAGVLRGAGIEAEGALIDGMSEIIASGSGSRQLPGGMIFSCAGGAFSLSAVKKERDPAPFSVSFEASALEYGDIEATVFEGKKVILCLKSVKKQKKITKVQKKDLTYCLDYDRMINVVKIRSRLPGDKLRCPDRGCAKTLKNLFQENNTPVQERRRRIVLADDEGVLWVEGLGPDERVAVTDETSRLIEIKVEDVM